MSNGQGNPGDEFDFDSLYALDEERFQQVASGQAVQEGDSPPAQAAGEPTPNVSGGQEAPVSGSEGGGNPAGSGATDTGDDWRSQLPEDVRARIDAEIKAREEAALDAENRFKALQGRLGPTQRELSAAQARLAALERNAGMEQPASPPVIQPGQSLDSYYDSEDWKDWEETYPGDAKVLRSALNAQQKALQEQIARIEGRYTQLEQRLEQTATAVTSRVVNDEISRLDEAHPEWRDYDKSDEFWAWADEWRASQPKSLRGVFYDEANWRQMWNDADFTIARISEYKAAKAPAPAPSAAPVQPTAPEQQPASTHTAATPPVRDPRLAMGVAPEVRGSASVPPAIPTDGMNEDQLFDHLWRTLPSN